MFCTRVLYSLRLSESKLEFYQGTISIHEACVTVRGAEWTAVLWIIFAVRRMAIALCRNFGQLWSYIKRSGVYIYSYVSASSMMLRTLHPLCPASASFVRYYLWSSIYCFMLWNYREKVDRGRMRNEEKRKKRGDIHNQLNWDGNSRVSL